MSTMRAASANQARALSCLYRVRSVILIGRRLIRIALILPVLGSIEALAAIDDPKPIEGYAWPLSAAPGQTIDFYVSDTSGRGSTEVEFARHKADAQTDYEEVTKEVKATTTFQPTDQSSEGQPWRNVQPWRNGAGWNRSFSYTIPQDWPSGIYSARLLTLDGEESFITFIVKPHPDKRSRLAVIANVNTWLAYNRWGGAGKYCSEVGPTCSVARPARVSFLRPNHRATPIGERSSHHHLARGEMWILGWLEDTGYEPDVYTDIDFHNGEISKGGYRTLVLSTHPEYWSVTMYKKLTEFLNAGGSLLYLGGNGIYENAEYINDQQAMAFRADNEGGPRAAALFRTLGYPERRLLGVATERCGVGSEPESNDRCSSDVGGPYEVLLEHHPFIEATGLRTGQVFGGEGWNTGGGSFNGKASAWEVDSSAGPGATGIPCDCATEAWSIPQRACRRFEESITSLEARRERWQRRLREHPQGKAAALRQIRELNRQIAAAKADLEQCTRTADLPAKLQILARARNWCDGGVIWDGACVSLGLGAELYGSRAEWKGAEMTYYDHPKGGFVLSVGSITFGGSLVRDTNAQKIVKAALAEAKDRAARRR